MQHDRMINIVNTGDAALNSNMRGGDKYKKLSGLSFDNFSMTLYLKMESN